MTPAEAIILFAEQVVDDESLRDRLAAIQDHAAFAETCASVAAERGLMFTAAEMRAHLQARHIFWIQRHIE